MTRTTPNDVIALNGATKLNGGSKPADWKENLRLGSSDLFSESITGKILRVAHNSLQGNDPPEFYPELVPQTGEKEGKYSRRPADFWTCGFFPGSIYALLERVIKYPKSMRHSESRLLLTQVGTTLQVLGEKWSEPLRRMAQRIDTHDLGFMIMPHMQPRWELLHDQKALDTICTAATSLYSRFDPRVGAIRSWDHLTWQRDVDIRDKQENFLVIIDSLCNLELLFYAAEHTGLGFLANAAVTHAKTLLRTHLRREPMAKTDNYQGSLYSTCHVVNFSPATGRVKEIRTAQGFSPSSTWTRGQAWAILGYTQTYNWTRDNIFLEAACGLTEYFLLRLETAPSCVEIAQLNGQTTGRYVPLWDFDAPIQDPKSPLRDVSAGVIAANGILLLAQALMSLGRYRQAQRYLTTAMKIIDDTISLSLSRERLRLEPQATGHAHAVQCDPGQSSFDSILRNSTVTWNEQSRSKSANHGLVYADYYFILFGNRLLQLGYADGLKNNLDLFKDKCRNV